MNILGEGAAEGMPDETRRRALAMTGAGLMAALVASLAETAPASAEPCGMAAAIAVHRAAREAFNRVLNREDDAEEAYFAVHPKEIVVPLSIGGGQSFHVKFDLAEYAAGVRTEIGKRYDAEARSPSRPK